MIYLPLVRMYFEKMKVPGWRLVLICCFALSCNNDNQTQSSVPLNQESPPQDNRPVEDTTNVEESFIETQDFEELVQRYEDPGRTNWQNPELILDKLGDLEGKTIADIGAGTGYFSFRLARNAQKVIAIDIDERFLEFIEKRKLEYPQGIAENIITRLTNEHDPSLNPGEADAVIIVNTYPFIEDRIKYFSKVKKGLKNDGVLMIVDYKKGNMPVGPPAEIKLSPDRVFSELRDAGFKNFNIDETSLRYQYIIIAR